MNTLKTRKYMTRDERLQQAFEILARAAAPLRVGQVARRMGLSRNSNWYVQGFVDELVRDGDAIKIVHFTTQHLPTHYYVYLDLSDGADEYSEQAVKSCAMVDSTADWWYAGDGVYTNAPEYGDGRL